MAKQLHKRFTAEQVKALLQKYLHEGIELVYKDRIYEEYGQKVSLPTIINRAKNLKMVS